MVTFRESLKNASQAAVCTLLAGTEAASWLGGSLRPGGGENPFAEAVRKQRRVVCGNPDDDVTLPEAPFSGGQCPGAIYQINYTREVRRYTSSNCTSNQFLTLNANNTGLVGPISGISNSITGGGCGAGGSRTITTVQTGAGPVELQNAFWSLGIVPGSYVIKNIVVIRTDGGIDNCGNISPDPPPYSPVTINRNITYIDNSNTEITEEGDFNILAPVFIGGAIIAPIKVDVGGVEFPLNFNLETGEITFDFSRDFTETPTPEVQPDPTVEPPEPEPEVESDDLIYGLIVYSSPSGVHAVTSPVAQSAAPTLNLPRTGNVYFQTPIGDRVTWEGPIPVQMNNQLIMTPSGLGATGYRVVPNTGWNLEAVRVGKPR